jgi:hypothetical protein
MINEDIVQIIKQADIKFKDASSIWKRKAGWIINIKESARCDDKQALSLFKKAVKLKILTSCHLHSHDYSYTFNR